MPRPYRRPKHWKYLGRDIIIYHNNGSEMDCTLKKVSSTGNMNDERASAVGIERKWHQRRGKIDKSDSDIIHISNKTLTTLRPSSQASQARPLSPARNLNSSWLQSLHAAATASSGEYQMNHPLPSSTLIAPDQTTQYIMEECTTKVPKIGNRIKRQHKKSILLRLDERSSIDNTNALSSLSKPRLKRIQTDPSITHRSKTALVDDELMNRALSIRENLREYEMQELAAEAERAAEEGMERFVGVASKFIGDAYKPYNYFSSGGYEDDFVMDFNVEKIRSRPTGGSEYTPSYFSKKKIRVTSLREFNEVVPPFERIHHNIRLHLKQRGVDERVLPDEECQMCPTTSDEDDMNSQAASQAGSIASFSSFAITSLRGMMDYMGNSRQNPTISSYEKQFSTSGMSTSMMGFDSCCGSIEFEADVVAENVRSKQFAYETLSPAVDDSSGDSSVELCKRRDSLNGRVSPSSVHGVLSGASDDKILGRRELFTDYVEDRSHTPSITSHDATQSVATFFTRMQHKFSGTPGAKKGSSPSNKEGAKFISNYFYTNQDANNVNLVGISNFKLDINPDRKRNDAFCISSGCVQNDLLSGCETVGNALDVIFTWFNERGRGCNATTAPTNSRSLDPRNPNIILHHSWIWTWQAENGGDHRRFFMPPRLAGRDFRFESEE